MESPIRCGQNKATALLEQGSLLAPIQLSPPASPLQLPSSGSGASVINTSELEGSPSSVLCTGNQFSITFTAAGKASKYDLLNQLQEFDESENDSVARLSNFWSREKRKNIFDTISEISVEDLSQKETAEVDSSKRLRRLEQARNCINEAGTDWETKRILLIFLAHELDYISKSDFIETSRGMSKVAASKIFIRRNITVSDVDWKRCRNVQQILQIGGPASLLINDARNVWERAMSKEDIKAFFQKHVPHMPELQRIHKWIKSQNQAAATAIVSGLLLYGWSDEELLASETMVIVALKPYLKVAISEGRRHKESQINQPKSSALHSNYGSTSLRDISDPMVIANLASSVANFRCIHRVSNVR